MSDLKVDITAQRGGMQIQVALAAPRGAVTALLGPSGSGKTSVLRMIAGLDRPSAGRISFADAVWFDQKAATDMPVARRGAGFVFQDYALFPHMTAAQNVGYGVPRRNRRSVVAHWLRQMDLADSADRYPRELSGGQRQRVALARTLAARPRLLLLDEPFCAVDIQLRRHLHGVLHRAAADLDCPVLMVSHDLAEVRKLAQQLVVMAAGTVLATGPTARVFAAPPTPQVAELLGARPGAALPSPVQCCRCGGWREAHAQDHAHGTALAQ